MLPINNVRFPFPDMAGNPPPADCLGDLMIHKNGSWDFFCVRDNNKCYLYKPCLVGEVLVVEEIFLGEGD